MTARRAEQGGACPRVRRLFGASVQDRCSERRCCLGLYGIRGCVILRGEDVASGKKMCGCIVFHDAAGPRVVLVELKSGLVHTMQVIEKFTNALEWLSSVEGAIFGSDDYRITLLPLHKRLVPRTHHSILRSHPFRLGGRGHLLRGLRCNTQLSELYKKMSSR